MKLNIFGNNNILANNNKDSFLNDSINKLLKANDKSSFSIKQKIFFFRELGYLLKGGVGIVESVKIIGENTDNFALKDITKSITTDLNSGKALSFALMKQLEFFDEGDIAIIKSGEKTGNLGKIAQSLSEQYQFITKVKNKYVGALTYPIIVLIIGFLAVIGLFTFILPGIFKITEQMQNAELPGITIFLKSMSEFITTNRAGMLIGLVVLVLILSIMFSTNFGQRFLFEKIIFRIPVVGNITKSYFLIKISRYTKIMIDAGISYVEIFKLMKEIINLVVYDDLFDDISNSLKTGKTVYDGVKQNLTLIPPTSVALIKVGEKTANLGESFGNISEIYEEELNANVNSLSKIIEPVMLVLIGGIVILVALGVFGIIGTVMDGVKM